MYSRNALGKSATSEVDVETTELNRIEVNSKTKIDNIFLPIEQNINVGIA